jgi:hypothetical protein
VYIIEVVLLARFLGDPVGRFRWNVGTGSLTPQAFTFGCCMVWFALLYRRRRERKVGE